MHRSVIHFEIIGKLKNKIIVSSQASVNEPFYKLEAMESMVQSVIDGGAGGLRLAGKTHILHLRKLTKLPIIGITKPDIIPDHFKDVVYITPSFTDAKEVALAGSDIIALDATMRQRPKESLSELIDMIHSNLNKPVMADISNLEEALNAERLGADIVSTTLAGYTSHTKQTNGPDFELLDLLVKNLHVPIILEGRVETSEHVKKSFELGAYAVVIGSAITRPHLITQKFVGEINSL